MQIDLCKNRPTHLMETLTELWEKSVKATHSFLLPEDIPQIKNEVRMGLNAIPLLMIARENVLAGFMGIDGHKIEMLFLKPELIGKGIGKALIQHGITQYGITCVSVNEQNINAKKFYLHMGFKIIARDALDNQGRPYPILHMELADKTLID